MKEFMKTKTVTYNLMSFTGFKSLYVFSLLLEAPKSYAEICEAFKNHEFIKEAISIDTLRVYLTSLKRAGCEIVRTKKAEGSKYKLVSHPFQLEINEEQINALAKVYKNISKNVSLEEMIILDKFLRKLVSLIANPLLEETYKKVTVFKGINMVLLEDLMRHCKAKEQITFLYDSPKNGKKELQILTDKIDFSNGKLYLYGTGFEYKQYGYFLVSRIEKIMSIALHKTDLSGIEVYTVEYELKGNLPELKLGDDEKIIETKNDNTVLVEYKSSNMFMIKQKILSYGCACKVVYPESVRDEIIATLKEMRAGYIDGTD